MKKVRQKKSDRLIAGYHSKDAIRCDYAVAPVDRLTIEMDQKWGIDVLVELVSVETASKYGSARGKLNDAIVANDPEECELRAGVVIRGLRAMDAEAERLGAQRASEDLWEIEVDDVVYGVMKDARSWRTIKEKRPELELLTLREVALAYRHWLQHNAAEFEKAVKKSFEGAEVVDIRSKGVDDPIPF